MLFAIGCRAQPQPADTIVQPNPNNLGVDSTMLLKHWYHSSEEQVDDRNQIYRSDGGKLPPSRFRMQYLFHADGTCDWYFLSPDDNHVFKQGRWKVTSGDSPTLVITKGEVVETYRINKLTSDVMHLAPISSTQIPQ